MKMRRKEEDSHGNIDLFIANISFLCLVQRRIKTTVS